MIVYLVKGSTLYMGDSTVLATADNTRAARLVIDLNKASSAAMLHYNDFMENCGKWDDIDEDEKYISLIKTLCDLGGECCEDSYYVSVIEVENI